MQSRALLSFIHAKSVAQKYWEIREILRYAFGVNGNKVSPVGCVVQEVSFSVVLSFVLLQFSRQQPFGNNQNHSATTVGDVVLTRKKRKDQSTTVSYEVRS
jgi:hypothetical protein